MCCNSAALAIDDEIINTAAVIDLTIVSLPVILVMYI
jgi:hypothetical protein